MTPEDIALLQDLNAALVRQLERQGYQLDRMQDQLERALRELELLRRAANKPPPDDPPPAPAAWQPVPEIPAPAPSPAVTGVPEPWKPRKNATEEKKPRRSFSRNKIPAGLERQFDPHVLGACTCGSTTLAGLRTEEVEVYDFVPAQLVARVVQRTVSRCKRCQHIAMAPFPDELAPRMQATPRLIAQCLPLHRIDAELVRLGGEIREVTRDRWLRWAAVQLGRLMPSLMQELFSAGLHHTDGTGLDVIRPGVGTQLGQMAVFCNERAVICSPPAALPRARGRERRANRPRRNWTVPGLPSRGRRQHLRPHLRGRRYRRVWLQRPCPLHVRRRRGQPPPPRQ